jgi:cytochrome P450
LYFFYEQIIKFKRQALENEKSPENENDANSRIEDELYVEALKKFPELQSWDKQEVLTQMRTLSVSKPEVKQEDEDIPTRKIFIDHVLCNETKFNDAEVRDHVYTIVAAGSETTALQTAHTSEKFMQID